MEAMAMSVFQSLKGGNFIKKHYRVTSFGQNVAHVLVHKFVKFDEKSMELCKSYCRDILKIGKIYEIAIYGKATTPPSSHIFKQNKIL